MLKLLMQTVCFKERRSRMKAFCSHEQFETTLAIFLFATN